MNTKVIKAKHNSDNPYLSISMLLIRDTRLNSISKSIMIEILSTDYNQWELNMEMLRKRLDVAKRPFAKCIRELKEYKYIEQKYLGDHKWSYTIYETGDIRPSTGEQSDTENMKQKCERKRREAEYFKKSKKQTVQNRPV